MIQYILSGSQVGYHGIKSGSPSTGPDSQHWNFHANFKQSAKFLGSQVGPPATKIWLTKRISGGLQTAVNTFRFAITA